MNQEPVKGRSQLFTLRVWLEDVGNACAEPSRSSQTELRGTLKHVLTGEIHHFRDWDTLINLIQSSFAVEQTEISKKIKRIRK